MAAGQLDHDKVWTPIMTATKFGQGSRRLRQQQGISLAKPAELINFDAEHERARISPTMPRPIPESSKAYFHRKANTTP